MAHLILQPQMLALNNLAAPLSGAKAYVFDAGTSTPRATYPTAADAEAGTNAQSHPVIAQGSPAPGVFEPMYVNTAGGPYKLDIRTSAGVSLSGYPRDDIPVSPLSGEEIGALIYPRTSVEISAGITPVSYIYPVGHPYRYGTNTTPGTTNMTAAINTCADVCRSANVAMTPPGETMLVSSSLNFTGIRVYGERGDGAVTFQATSAQFDVITTQGDCTLENIRVDGGWDGVTAGQSGNNIAVTKSTGDQFPYLVSIHNVVSTNAKRSSIYLRRPGYTNIYAARCLTAGLHSLEIEGATSAAAATTVQVSGNCQFGATPNGYGIKITDGVSIDINGAILEDTAGIQVNGNDNRALSFRQVYQENFTHSSTAFATFGTSGGIGLTIENCFGGNKTVGTAVNWVNVDWARGNSNLSFAGARPLDGRDAGAGNIEATTTTTGSNSYTAASVVLGAGNYIIIGTLNCVPAAGTPALSDVGIVITTTVGDSGFSTTTTTDLAVEGSARQNGGITGSVAVLQAMRYLAHAGGTVYLRAGLNFAAGTMAYNGRLTAIQIP